MNIVTKTITTLPEDVCNIIYEYYKLPYADEIQNPFNKDQLYDSLRRYIPNGEKRKTTKFYNDSIIIIDYSIIHDWKRKTIFGEQIINLERNVKRIHYNGFFNDYLENGFLNVCDPHLKDRDYLKNICDMNGIEYKKGTQRKALIKKLMKL